ncbi:MAG: glycogen synthase GlgA [Vicinamibacterales bacterium]
MRVLMVAAECFPYAKSGGLGDVVGALPSALAARGHDVVVVLPRYRGVDVERQVGSIDLQLGPRHFQVPLQLAHLAGGVRVWLVDEPSLFDRPSLYGVGQTDYADNALRFAMLSKAALQAAAQLAFRPDIVHAHDWHAGLVPLYLRTDFATTTLARARTVFTIHNLAYQGLFDAHWVPALGIDWHRYNPEGLEFWGRLSFLKAGINYADAISTVSPGYAREILTPSLGCGFDGILRRRVSSLTGILNGIDTQIWDPATDPFLPAHYSVRDLEGKRALKRALLERVGLWSERALAAPVVGMVSRMVDQKGLDLIQAVAHRLPRLGATFVIHGTGEARYEDMWRELAADWPDRIAAVIGFDEALAHLIEAGSDIWMMPSRFEPCGLNQMYSQRYGTVPVVRATGGLGDTVEAFDPTTGAGTGFTFAEASSKAFLDALKAALTVFADRPVWQRLQRAGMNRDFSWAPAARSYEDVYRAAIERWTPSSGGGVATKRWKLNPM